MLPTPTPIELPRYATESQRRVVAAVCQTREATLTGFVKDGSALIVTLSCQAGAGTLPYLLKMRVGPRGATRTLQDNSPGAREARRRRAEHLRLMAMDRAERSRRPTMVVGRDGGYLRLW